MSDYLRWKGDWELWEGAAIALAPPPSPRHQAVAGNLFAQLKGQLLAHSGCKGLW